MIEVDLSQSLGTQTAGSLTQWDFGQILRITGLNIEKDTEVHFACQGDTKALITVGKYSSGHIDAEIPDVLLQTGKMIYAFVYPATEDEGKTVRTVKINVNKRPKPSNYAPPERQSYLEGLLEVAELNMVEINNFSDNMESATNNANEAAERANEAADEAEAAAKACEGIVDGLNTMVDTVTGTACVLTIEDGILTIREA